MADTEENTQEFDPFATPDKKTGRGGAWLALLALLLVLLVAGWNGWQWWQKEQGAEQAAELSAALARLDRVQAELSNAQRAQTQRIEAFERLELDRGLTQLDEAIAQARSVAGSDRARLEGLETSLGEVLGLLDRLESRMAALVVRGESPRQGLELAEVDYLLRSATERLSLYGDVRSADQALALADAQLDAMDDPVYLTVRQAIAASRLALESIDRPDYVVLTERLASLQAQIPGLPFPGEVSQLTAAGPAVVEDPGVWQRFTSALGDLVSVRRSDDDLLLVSLEDKDTVRQALWLQFEGARLALLREDDAAYQSALQRATATLEQYFDPRAEEVSAVATSIATLQASSLAVSWPDISEPWTRLKSIREPRDAAPASAAAPPQQAAELPEAAPEPAPAEPDPVEVPEDDPEGDSEDGPATPARGDDT